MKRLQDNLNYYNRQYQSIVNNKNSYTSTRTNNIMDPGSPTHGKLAVRKYLPLNLWAGGMAYIGKGDVVVSI